MTPSNEALAPISTEATGTPTLAELEAFSHPALLLDEQGCVVEVNRALHNALRRGDASDLMRAELGASYIAFCGSVEGSHGLAVARGIDDIVNGRAVSFELVYSFHSPTQLRWFRLEARRSVAAERGMLVLHIDVTDSYMASARLNIQMSVSRALNSSMGMLAVCRELAIRVCEELDWDYAGIWTLDVRSWTLRCVDSWLREGIGLGEFERASRAAALGPGVGLPGRAWLTAKVQWATDLDSAPAPPPFAQPSDHLYDQQRVMPPSSLLAGCRTALAFPIKCGDDVLAVVDVFSVVRRAPDHALMDVLEVAGDQLALWELRARAEECMRVAQHEADEARSQLESVLDCAPAFVVVLDASGEVRFVNRPFPLQRKEDVVGAHWTTFVPASGHAQVQAAVAAVMSTGTPQTYQLSFPGPNASTLWFANYMGPMRSGDAITGAVIIAQDVTAAKVAQSELADAQRLAAVGTLAAGVAHEINTPVQFVNDSVHFLRDATGDLLGLTNQLLELKRLVEQGASQAELASAAALASAAEEQADLSYLSEHMPKAFERSLDGLERVAGIVRSMKEFAHPAQKDMGPADLNRAITSTLTVARGEYKYVADLEMELGDLPPVTCHVNQINQVVLNIVVNAAHAIGDVVKGTGEKGLIKVCTRREGESVILTISDSGKGIPPHVAPHIFEPFYTTKEVGRGTGQGLAMAWNVIREVHGGDLSFETKPGEGTTFCVRLPVAGKE